MRGEILKELRSLLDLVRPQAVPVTQATDRIGNSRALYSAVSRWQELSVFFDSSEVDFRILNNQMQELIFSSSINSLFVFKEGRSGEWAHSTVVARAQIAASFLRDSKFFEPLVVAVSENLDGQYIDHKRDRILAPIVDSILQPESADPLKQSHNAHGSSLKRVVDFAKFAAGMDAALAAIVPEILPSSSELRMHSSEDTGKYLSQVDQIVWALIENPNLSIHGAFDLANYARERIFDALEYKKKLEANRVSGNPKRIIAADTMAYIMAMEDVRIAEWYLKNASEKPEQGLLNIARGGSRKNSKVVELVKKFALKPESIRPQGVSDSTIIAYLSEIIEMGEATSAHIRKAERILRSLKRFDYGSSRLVEKMLAKNLLEESLIDELTPKISEQVLSKDLNEANQAAGLILAFNRATEVSPEIARELRARASAAKSDSTTGGNLRDMKWLLAFLFPGDISSVQVAEAAQSFEAERLGDWITSQERTPESAFRNLVRFVEQPGMFGAFVSKELAAIVGELLAREPANRKLWEIVMTRFGSRGKGQDSPLALILKAAKVSSPPVFESEDPSGDSACGVKVSGLAGTAP